MANKKPEESFQLAYFSRIMKLASGACSNCKFSAVQWLSISTPKILAIPSETMPSMWN